MELWGKGLKMFLFIFFVGRAEFSHGSHRREWFCTLCSGQILFLCSVLLRSVCMCVCAWRAKHKIRDHDSTSRRNVHSGFILSPPPKKKKKKKKKKKNQVNLLKARFVWQPVWPKLALLQRGQQIARVHLEQFPTNGGMIHFKQTEKSPTLWKPSFFQNKKEKGMRRTFRVRNLCWRG